MRIVLQTKSSRSPPTVVSPERCASLILFCSRSVLASMAFLPRLIFKATIPLQTPRKMAITTWTLTQIVMVGIEQVAPLSSHKAQPHSSNTGSTTMVFCKCSADWEIFRSAGEITPASSMDNGGKLVDRVLSKSRRIMASSASMACMTAPAVLFNSFIRNVLALSGNWYMRDSRMPRTACPLASFGPILCATDCARVFAKDSKSCKAASLC
mmetsp:Transcript_32425/g.61067  ORF Transcript_32425/g.61067 Transcript_32425/m.61067 type:complete len:211 (+) Transcript_32425:988-1620(+)